METQTICMIHNKMIILDYNKLEKAKTENINHIDCNTTCLCQYAK